MVNPFNLKLLLFGLIVVFGSGLNFAFEQLFVHEMLVNVNIVFVYLIYTTWLLVSLLATLLVVQVKVFAL